ncbi:DUF3108 domain-containing protein [Ideonella sp. B7]|uniref:DUF3108 domain-containing protein n=1 Tax=Ideonella benzenivorans TaxID=2831643 RepID=UPI002873292C|nr:DUF3108 domain-containing protein [Ideonella benzenivorans]MCA6216865.1 DUF3108 domain-containing protein [Ideonella benzenivorans]
MTPTWRWPGRRVLALAVLVAGVLALHLWVVDTAWRNRLGDRPTDRPPPPIEVAFVKALAPATPPVAAAAAPVAPRRRPRRVAVAASASPASAPAEEVASAGVAAASAPQEAASAPPADTADSAPAAADAGVAAASAPASSAEVATAASAAASDAQAFDWPPSTRLSYTVQGNYRGPLSGAAQVEWRRQDSHYQVRVTVQLAAAFERRMLSDGELTADGLKPRRYDQVTRIVLRDPRQETVHFNDDTIALATGKTVPTMPGVQDAASQFVQLTWLFLTHPERLRPGQEVEFPLALPRRAGRWRYRVLPAEPLALPFGALYAYPLKPVAGTLRPNEVAVEMWIAPTLQYLPVRIGMNWKDEATLDMVLDSAPLQAAP